MFELAMTAACGREEPTVILQHSKYLADLHQFRISGEALARGIVPLRHNVRGEGRALLLRASRSTVLCTPDMGMSLWGESPLWEDVMESG